MNKPGNILATISKMQKTMAAVQKDIENSVFEGDVSEGLVKVSITGKGELVTLKLDDAVRGEDLETLEDLIKVAFKNAYDEKEKYAKQKLKALAPGMGTLGLAVPGLGG